MRFPDDLPLPIAIDLPLDQYKATVDLNQVIYGGNSVRNTKRVNAAAEKRKRLRWTYSSTACATGSTTPISASC